MRIGVISDTHGNLRLTELAIQALQQQDVLQVLHCGDIGSPAVVSLFGGWPTHFVTGNVDHNTAALSEAAERAGQTFHGRFGDIELAGRRVALVHGDDAFRLREAVSGGEYDLVCTGHTHRAAQHRDGRTLVLNPGAVYRANPHTVAVVDLETLTAEHIVVVPAAG